MTSPAQCSDIVPYPATLLTAEDLMANPVPNKRTELVAGRMIVSEPPGYRHGYVVSRIHLALGFHVRSMQGGHVLDAGARLVWIVDPEHRTASVYRADGSHT